MQLPSAIRLFFFYFVFYFILFFFSFFFDMTFFQTGQKKKDNRWKTNPIQSRPVEAVSPAQCQEVFVGVASGFVPVVPAILIRKVVHGVPCCPVHCCPMPFHVCGAGPASGPCTDRISKNWRESLGRERERERESRLTPLLERGPGETSCLTERSRELVHQT